MEVVSRQQEKMQSQQVQEGVKLRAGAGAAATIQAGTVGRGRAAATAEGAAAGGRPAAVGEARTA